MVYFSQQIAQMKQIYEHQALSCHPEQREGSQINQSGKVRCEISHIRSK